MDMGMGNEETTFTLWNSLAPLPLPSDKAWGWGALPALGWLADRLIQEFPHYLPVFFAFHRVSFVGLRQWLQWTLAGLCGPEPLGL